MNSTSNVNVLWLIKKSVKIWICEYLKEYLFEIISRLRPSANPLSKWFLIVLILGIFLYFSMTLKAWVTRNPKNRVNVCGRKKLAQWEVKWTANEIEVCRANANENAGSRAERLSSAPSRCSRHCEHSAHSASNIVEYDFQCKTLHFGFENCFV